MSLLSEVSIVLDESSNESSLPSSPSKRASPQAAKQEVPAGTTSLQNKSGGNRRKSGHHRIIQDDNISFESVTIEKTPTPVPVREESTSGVRAKAVPSSSSTSVAAKDSTNFEKDADAAVKKRKTEATLPSFDDFLTEGTSNDEDTYPNMELAKKVAFLRASVNYLMLNLGRRPFDFSRPKTLVELIGEYNMQNRKAAQETDK